MCVGVNLNPNSSIWRGKEDGYTSLIKEVLDSITIQQYNTHILYKEQLYEENENFVEMSDGQDILDALLA